MTFAVVYLAALLLPGWLMACALRVRDRPVFLVVPLSLAWAVASLLAAKLAHSGWGTVLGVYLGGVAAFAVLAARAGRDRIGDRAKGPELLVTAASAGAAAAYAVWAGPYLETPSDGLWHVGQIRRQWLDIGAQSLLPVTSLGSLIDKGQAWWYATYAGICRVSGCTLNESLGHANVINMALVAAGVSQFAWRVLARSPVSAAWRPVAALLAAAFFVAQFGLDVFSYARYYTFGPTFLNFLGYFAIVVLTLRTMDGKTTPAEVALALLLLASTALLHRQEAMFVLVMAALMLGVRVARLHRERLAALWAGTTVIARPTGLRTRDGNTLALLATVLAYGCLHAYLYTHVRRADPLETRSLFAVEHVVPFIRNAYILIPTGRLWQVVSTWGVVVYAFFVYKRRTFVGNDFLLAGMWAPVLTVLNPLFVDFFLRLSWPDVLWRLCYLVPLYVVGAAAATFALERLLRGTGIARAKAALTLLLLAGLLFPVKSTFFVNRAKWPTLAPVAPERDFRHWGDLWAELEKYPGRLVLTDPVTGYMANAFSSARYPGYKFHAQFGFDVRRAEYRDEEFAPYRNSVLVVNTRDGAESEVGRLSRHWSADALKVSRSYGPALLQFVAAHPQRFAKTWEANGIALYEIR